MNLMAKLPKAMSNKIRIAVSGASGRMGQAIILTADEHPNIESICAFESIRNNKVDTTAADGKTTIQTIEQIDFSNIDVLIDFTTPTATLEFVQICVENNTGMVIGTTGFTKAETEQLHIFSNKIPILMAQNMSIGVNVTYELAKIAASLLCAGRSGGGYDIEIFEAHHKHKKDAPSGTALQLGKIVAQATNGDLDIDAVFARQRRSDTERKPQDIGFSVVRGGDIVGEHRVIFAGAGEQIEITHRSTSRNNYAAGAIRAAQFIATAPATFYDGMDAVFGDKS